MSRPRNPNDLIRIEDAIKVLCRKTCHPGIACPDIYCKEMWDEFEDVERVDAVPVVRCKDCLHNRACEIQYHAQAGDLFFCGAAEQKDGDRHD